MVVAVLAVQGAFLEHEQVLKKLNVPYFEIRQKKDLEKPMDGLILPGGESTVQGKLLKDLDLYLPIKERIEDGLPVLGTCAGMILLAEHISGEDTVHFGTLPVTVKRNAYGRQLGSFYIESEFKDAGIIPMTYIRAPYIESAGIGVDVLSRVHGNITGVQYKNQIGVSFHPELNDNYSIHKMFINKIVE